MAVNCHRHWTPHLVHGALGIRRLRAIELRTRRMPTLLFRFSGELALRQAARKFLALLFQEPPGSARCVLRDGNQHEAYSLVSHHSR